MSFAELKKYIEQRVEKNGFKPIGKDGDCRRKI